MDSGDGGTSGASAEESGRKVACFYMLPVELKFLLDLYRINRRMQSSTEAMRRLLETHPDLTRLADMLYNGENSTSPPS